MSTFLKKIVTLSAVVGMGFTGITAMDAGHARPAPVASTGLSDSVIDSLARGVLAGKYGNGDQRRKALGSNYNTVQKRVNAILKGGSQRTTVKKAKVVKKHTKKNVFKGRVAGPKKSFKSVTVKVPKKKSTHRATTKNPHIRMTIHVPLSGGQRQIDRCAGPVLMYGYIVAQHNYCGGTRFHNAKMGSYIKLTGKVNGVYKVTKIKDARVGDPAPVYGDVMLQTCAGPRNNVRLWGLTKVR